jgi:hypothetical protein
VRVGRERHTLVGRVGQPFDTYNITIPISPYQVSSLQHERVDPERSILVQLRRLPCTAPACHASRHQSSNFCNRADSQLATQPVHVRFLGKSPCYCHFCAFDTSRRPAIDQDPWYARLKSSLNSAILTVRLSRRLDPSFFQSTTTKRYAQVYL